MNKLNKKIAPRTWIEINKKALAQNVSVLKNVLPAGCKAMFVVKANAYGHGLSEVISVLQNDKHVDMFGVFSFEDALFIRTKSKKPIVMLSTFDILHITEAIVHNIEVTISRLDQLAYIQKKKLSKKLKVHLKVDTGLGRQGFLRGDIGRIADLISKIKQIELVGLYTHLSGAESKQFDSYTIKQYTELMEWKNALTEKGLYPTVHTSATSGVIRNRDLACNMVRFGIGMYGLWPSVETAQVKKNSATLLPVLSWRTTIVEAKELPKGSYIAYDCTCKLEKKTRIAVLPVGYWDGLPRSASHKASVLIKGKKCPLLGRIMMNMCVVDVSAVPGVTSGDIATLIGVDGKGTISAEALALDAGTINYEIVTRINPLIPRLIVNS